MTHTIEITETERHALVEVLTFARDRYSAHLIQCLKAEMSVLGAGPNVSIKAFAELTENYNQLQSEADGLLEIFENLE